MRISCASYDAAAELLAFGASYGLVSEATGIPTYTLAVIAETVPYRSARSGRPFSPSEQGLQRIDPRVRADLARVLAAIEDMMSLGSAPLESVLAAYRLYVAKHGGPGAASRLPMRMLMAYACALFGLWGRPRTDEIRLLRCERCGAPVIAAAHVLTASKACLYCAGQRRITRRPPALPEPGEGQRPQTVPVRERSP